MRLAAQERLEARAVVGLGASDPELASRTHLDVQQGGEGDTEGFVDFKAYYTLGGEDITHHEVASFRKEDGVWYFVDGVEVKPRPFKRESKKIGPNEPCPCGSGKKHKKCHGRPGAATS